MRWREPNDRCAQIDRAHAASSIKGMIVMRLLLSVILLACIAAPVMADPNSANPFRKTMTRSSVTTDDLCDIKLRAGQTCFFMFGLNGGATDASAGTGDTFVIEAPEGGARVCLNPDSLTTDNTIAGTDAVVNVYLGQGGSGTAKLEADAFEFRNFSNSTVGTTADCYDTGPNEVFYITYTTVDNAADAPYVRVRGLYPNS